MMKWKKVEKIISISIDTTLFLTYCFFGIFVVYQIDNKLTLEESFIYLMMVSVFILTIAYILKNPICSEE